MGRIGQSTVLNMSLCHIAHKRLLKSMLLLSSIEAYPEPLHPAGDLQSSSAAYPTWYAAAADSADFFHKLAGAPWLPRVDHLVGHSSRCPDQLLVSKAPVL